MSTSNKVKLPVIYLSHGGGPCFFMDWSPIGPADTWNKTANWLKNLSHTFSRPKAIIVISAHWEEKEFTILTNEAPSLLFDYYGFPQHTYELKYPAKGSPELVLEIQKRLQAAGIKVESDEKRGFDHGVFIPFKLIYPEADIPILQISLKSGLNPATHIELGKALAPLREKGVLIVGSGMSYHNLNDLMRGNDVLQISKDFNQWLEETVSLASFENRNSKLQEWEKAPHARRVHPREEHLLPLMVISGAAGDEAGKIVFSDSPMGAVSSAIQFS